MFISPPASWKIPAIILLGVSAGMIIYILQISRFSSYLSEEPKTCMNCHIMAPQYATWSHSSHREEATCNDCHVPQNNFIFHYYFKAKDGLRHATIFTLRREPQVIQIRKAGMNVVQDNCIRCHEKQQACMQCHIMMKNEEDEITALNCEYDYYHEGRYCWECHREVPHGRVNSLSSVPYARVPLPSDPVPAWIHKIMK